MHTTTLTRTLAASALTVALLAGCTNDGDGGGDQTSAPPHEPTSTSSEASPTGSSDGESLAFPSSSIPHKSLDQGEEGGVPSHDVARYAYQESDRIIRAYVEEYPEKVTEPGVPDEVRQYVTDEFARSYSAEDEAAWVEGSHLSVEMDLVGDIKPVSWRSKEADAATMDACIKSDIREYDAEGAENTSWTEKGGGDPAAQRITRFEMRSGDNGETWLIQGLTRLETEC